MKRAILSLLFLSFLCAMPAWAQDAPPHVGWGVRFSGAGSLRADALDCAATAVTRSGRFKLTVLPDAVSRAGFVAALQSHELAEGLWVEFVPLGQRTMLSMLRLEAKTGRVLAQKLDTIDNAENRPCDLAFRLAWELGEKPLDPAAQKLIEQARAAWQAGRYLEADDLYRKALIVSAHAYVACREAGQMWESGGYADTARKWYLLALDRNPRDFITLSRLARLDEQAGRIDEALSEYERAVLYGPRLNARLMDLARLYRRHRRPLDAQRILLEVLELEPDHYVALGELVRVAEDNEDWPTAADALRKLIDHGLQGDQYKQELARFYMKGNDYAAAAQMLLDLLRHDPGNTELLRDYAIANFELGNYDVGEQTLRQLLDQKPDDLPTLRSLAQIYFQTKRFNEAVRALERAAQVSPSNLDILRLLGKAYELAGNRSGALYTYESLLRRAWRPTSDDLDRYVELAQSLNELDRARGTLNDLFRTVSGGQAKELVALTLGRLEERTGRIDAAIDIYQRDLEVTSYPSRVRFELGRLKLQQGDVGGAMNHFRRMDVRGLDPRLAVSAARLMKQAGQPDFATELFGMAYRRDKSQTVAGLLYLEGLMLTGQDRDNHRLIYDLDQTVVADAEREELLWLELFFAAEQHFDSFYANVRRFALFFIKQRPQTLVDLTMWEPIVRTRIAEPAQTELLDLLQVFARKMPVADFAAKYNAPTEPAAATGQ